MAPPLHWIAKAPFLPLELTSLIQQFAADKRDPHPVALLVKRFDTEWVLGPNFINYVFTLDTCAPGCRDIFQWIARDGDGVYTRQTMRSLETWNMDQRKRAKDLADDFNGRFRRREPNISRNLKRMFETMQGTKNLPCSLSSCPELPGCSAAPVRSKAWQSRGWGKHGSKRVKTGFYRHLFPNPSESDSD